MDDLEPKLARLALRGPSPDLDARIAAALAATPPVPVRRPVRAVPLRWALAAAMFMAALGFWAGRRAGPAVQPLSGLPGVTVRVVYEGTAANPFDCTLAADDGLPPVQTLGSTTPNGV